MVRIRPSTFQNERIANISHLYPIVQKASVDIGGWDFPHVDPREKHRIDIDWVGQESEWSNYLEVWRIYRSGQFVDVLGMPSDWRDQQVWWPAPEGWKPGVQLGIVGTVFQFTGIFELAARLCLTDVGDDVMHIEVTIHGLEDRWLVVDDPRRTPLSWARQASIPEFPHGVQLPRTELIAKRRELALTPAAELFRRFEYDPGIELLREIQAELTRRWASS